MPRRILLRSRSRRETLEDLEFNHPHPDDIEKDNFPPKCDFVGKIKPTFKNGPVSPDNERIHLPTVPESLFKHRDSIDSLLSMESEENTNRSTSSCSWNDDAGSENMEKIQFILDSIDDFLYDGNVSESLHSDLSQDCLTWSEQFQHLRLKGYKIKNSSNAYVSNELKDFLEDDETFASDGMLIREQDELENYIQSPISTMDVKGIKEKVFDQLFQHIMPRISEWQKVAVNSTNSRTPCQSAFRAKRNFRPLTADIENSRNMLPYISDQSLDGILTVSSKVLQDRKLSRLEPMQQSLSRPSSSTIWLQENRKNVVYRSQRRFTHSIPPLSTIPNSEIQSDLDYTNNYYKNNGNMPLPPVRRTVSSRLSSANSRPSTGHIRRRLQDINLSNNTKDCSSLPLLSVQPTSKLLSPRSSATVRYN